MLCSLPKEKGVFLATEESELHENELIAITTIALHAKMLQGKERNAELNGCILDLF